MKSVARRYARYSTTDVAFPIAFQSASGCRITDEDGKEYLDFITGYGVASTGWQHPEVLAAMREQLDRGCFAPSWLPTREAADLSEYLVDLAPPQLTTVARATSGAEANEIALRAHQIARGGKVLVIGRAYHGGTTRALASSDRAAFRLPLTMLPEPPRVPPAYCYRCPWGKTYPECSLECASAIDDAVKHDSTITSIFLEPIIGSGGAIVPPHAYYEAISEIVKRRNLALIVDEVMTGCGRTGTFFATTLKPNAITLGKGFGGGYVPIAAALVDDEFATALRKYEDVSATMSWTPLACAATLANIRVIVDNRLPENAAVMGLRLIKRLQQIFSNTLPEHTGEIRGKGLLIGVEIVREVQSREPHPKLAKRILLRCLREGLMIGTSWDWQTLLFIPPLILDDNTLNDALVKLQTALERCR